jgi:autotransporter-associated beta strand protein
MANYAAGADNTTLNTAIGNANADADTITFASVISVTAGLAGAGTGFTNSVGLIGTGGISLDAGTTLTVANLKTVTEASTLVISGASLFTKAGTGTLVLSGANTYTGGTSVAAGLVQVNNAASFGNGGTVQLIGSMESTAAHSDAHSFALGGGSITTSGGALTLSGILVGGALIKLGASDLILSGVANTFTGGVTLSAGNLLYAGDGSLGGAQSSVAMATGTSLAATAALTNTHSISLTGTTTIGDAFATTYSGVISGSGTLNKVGTGELVLAGHNTFSGAIALNAGTLTVGRNDALGSTTGVTLATGTTLSITSDATSATNITASGPTGIITVASGITFTETGTTAITGTLTKAGAGTLILGTTTGGTLAVTAGIVQVNSGVSTEAVTVASGASLVSVDGTVGALNVASGGVVAPGRASGGSGQLDTGNFTLASGATMTVDLNGSTATSGYDHIDVIGTVNLAGSLAVNVGYTAAVGDVFTILDNDGVDLISGTFAGYAEGATVSANGLTFRISYVGNGPSGNNNDVTLTTLTSITPTPTTPTTPTTPVTPPTPVTPGAAFVGTSGNDVANGGDANDTLQGNDGNDSLTGGNGNDVMTGDSGNDFLNGNAGNDAAAGGIGNDTVHGGQGDDTVFGDDGNDFVYGDFGSDQVSGGAGDDLIFGGQGPVSGLSDAADTISGGAGNDTINGNIGDDVIDGGDGNDWLYGGQNYDTISGGAGNDIIYGDLGNDSLVGGAGADLFVFARGAGDDRIADFKVSEGDQVHLEAGMTWTLTQVGSDAVVNVEGGGHVILSGISMASLSGTNWIGVG